MTKHAEAQALQATQPADKKPLGRPSSYNPATAEVICQYLAAGESLRGLCRKPGFPSTTTVYRWLMQHPDFHARYLRAREIGMLAFADETMEIADDDTLDVLSDGTPNPTSVNRARLQVHARHFLMSKFARNVFGDKVEVNHSGTVDHTVSVGDRERMRRLATFLDEDQASGALIDGTAADVTTPELVDPDLAEDTAPVPQSEQTHHEDDI